MAGKNSLELASKAPDFNLEETSGKKVRLADSKGKWVVLYFYPKDDTPGCTIEANQFTEQFKDFQKLNAVVLGVSPDNCQSHQKFVDKYGLKVTLLSDPEHRVMEQYGAWGEKNMYGKVTMGVIRSTTIIDPQGKVAHVWARVQAEGHAASVADKLKELQARSATAS